MIEVPMPIRRGYPDAAYYSFLREALDVVERVAAIGAHANEDDPDVCGELLRVTWEARNLRLSIS